MAKRRGSVAVVVGSDSDLPNMEPCLAALRELGVPHELRIISAHRTPDAVREFVRSCESGEVGVVIAAAGGAAHLAGVVASLTTLPVVGVPMPGGALGGVDALLSTVQMPGGVPVATFAVGRGGAVNAAVFAAEVIALSDEKVAARVRSYREALAEKVKAKDKKHRSRWPG
jgi:phosphoribosylaminoimidazole carboxylase PurE protein